MIYSISGEQPFQVLSDTFSVSPSQSGYDLYLSADGVNFSKFATVAADTTRQFNGMNSGNYYILSGNTSDVKVNWERDCGGGGGGGSAAGVSSLNGETGALNLKTVNSNSLLGEGDIEISGGGGYVIVDALSAITNPVEGMIAYVSSGVAEWAGWELENTQTEGYVANVYDSGQTDVLAAIYRSSDNYFWGWDNDGEWHAWSNGNVKTYYRKNLSNGYFDMVFEDASLVSVVMAEETYAMTPITYGVPYEAARYEYKDGAWALIDSGVKSYNLDAMTQAERAEFMADFLTLSEDEKKTTLVYRDGTICKYNRIDGTKAWFSLYFVNLDSDVVPVEKLRVFALRSDGSYEENTNKDYNLGMSLYVDFSTHALSVNQMNNIWHVGRAVRTGKCLITAIVKNGSTNLFSTNDVVVEYVDGYSGKVTVSFEYSGSTITGVWTYVENSITLESWTETQSSEGGGDYVVVDALSAITNPVEGMIAYIPNQYETVTFNGYEIVNQQSEGYVAAIWDSGMTGEIGRVYRSGDDYFWDWTNDGEWHAWSGGDVNAYYRKNLDNNYFDIVFQDISLVSVTLDDADFSKTEISMEQQVKVSDAVKYIYYGGSWRKMNYYIEGSYDGGSIVNPEEKNELIRFLVDTWGNRALWNSITVNGSFWTNRGARDMRMYPILRDSVSTTISFFADFQIASYDGYPRNFESAVITVSLNDNNFAIEYVYSTPQINLRIDENHNLVRDERQMPYEYIYNELFFNRVFSYTSPRVFVRDNNTDVLCLATYSHKGSNVQLFVDFNYDGVNYKGGWEYANNSWSNLYWNENPESAYSLVSTAPTTGTSGERGSMVFADSDSGLYLLTAITPTTAYYTIASASTAEYIDTGIYPTSATSIEFHTLAKGTGGFGTNDFFLLGTDVKSVDDSHGDIFLGYQDDGSKRTKFQYGGSYRQEFYNVSQLTDGTEYFGKIAPLPNEQQTAVKGTLEFGDTNVATLYYTSTFTNQATIKLNVSIWYCQSLVIKEGDTVVFDGEATASGFYDSVSQTTYTQSEGGVALTSSEKAGLPYVYGWQKLN